MADAAIAGLGLALLPTFILSGAVADGQLLVLELGAEAETDLIYAPVTEGRHHSAKVRTLINHLQAAFGDPPYWKA